MLEINCQNLLDLVYHLQIVSEDGLLGKNANKFVNKCSNFKSSITVSYAYKTVNAKSILAVLYLGATQYSFIEITISGTDEELAHDVIIEFLTDNL